MLLRRCSFISTSCLVLIVSYLIITIKYPSLNINITIQWNPDQGRAEGLPWSICRLVLWTSWHRSSARRQRCSPVESCQWYLWPASCWRSCQDTWPRDTWKGASGSSPILQSTPGPNRAGVMRVWGCLAREGAELDGVAGLARTNVRWTLLWAFHRS